MNFQNISTGSPFGSLPVDPVNQTSSGLYYTYTTTGSQYEIMAVMESTKYRSRVTGPLGNGIDIQGSGQGSDPVGWWPLNEGSGTIAYDTSGNGDNGTWHGSASGTNGYYSPGLINQWAGAFGTNTNMSLGTSNNLNVTTGLTILAWINLSLYQPTGSYGLYNVIVSRGINGLTETNYLLQVVNSSTLSFGKRTSPEDGQAYDSSAVSIPLNTWEHVGVTINNTSGTFYLNGASVGSFTLNGILSNSGLSMGATLGTAYQMSPATNFLGLMNDVRIYNRPLSPAEILAIYDSSN